MSEKLRKLLIQDEGEVNHAYQDSEGYWTIGVGRLIDKRKGGGISHDEAMLLLDHDIEKATRGAQTFNWFYSLNVARQAVVISMIFNMGLPTFSRFRKTIEYISLGEYQEAGDEMLDSLWAEQVGPRAWRLSQMMRSGEWND